MKNKAQTTFITVVLLGIVLAFVMNMYYCSPTKEKTAALESANAALQTRVDTLEKFYQEMPENKKKIAEMTESIKNWLDVFPADVKEEDAIYFALKAMNLDSLREMYDNDIITEEDRLLIPEAESEDESIVSFPSMTISVQERVASVDAELVQNSKIDGLTDGINFMKRNTTYVNSTDYEGLKCLIQTVNADPEKKTLYSLSYTADEEGVLSGSIAVTFYSMEGNGKEYQPKDLSEYMVGLENLFVKTEE